MTPAWDKGIQPISRESYWNAVACGKQPGDRPACVFYDADVCKNDDFTLALFTPYKMVVYEVWRAARQHQEAPPPELRGSTANPNHVWASPRCAGSRNPITAVVIKRGAQVVKPATQSLEAGGGKFIFDFAAFAPTEDIAIELVGRARTLSAWSRSRS